MKAKVYSKIGELKSEIKLSSDFDVILEEKKYSEYLNYVRANMRSAVANTKDRSEVRGGGKKPWKQKGTGRARHGSSRSPIWIGGGVTFGPSNERNFKKRMNKKTRAKMISSIFGHFATQEKLLIIEDVKIDEFKTKNAEKLIEKLNIEGKISLVLGKDEKESIRAFKNLPYIFIMSRNSLDIPNLASSDYLLITKAAYAEITQMNAGKVTGKTNQSDEVLPKTQKDK